MVKSRHRETSGVPVTIAVLGLLAFAGYFGARTWVEWVPGDRSVAIVVAVVALVASLVWYVRRRR